VAAWGEFWLVRSTVAPEDGTEGGRVCVTIWGVFLVFPVHADEKTHTMIKKRNMTIQTFFMHVIRK